MIRTLLLALTLSVLGTRCAWSSPVALEGQNRAAALASASESLNQAHSVRGRFTQIAPDGTASEGVFYLQRPGKLRFEYDPPASLTIIADGSVLSVADRKMKTDDRYFLRTTPLYFVLKRNVQLDGDGKVTRVERDGEALLITLRDRKREADGSITLVFDEPSKELREWRVIDGAGQTTQIILAQIQSESAIDGALFTIPPLPNAPGRRH